MRDVLQHLLEDVRYLPAIAAMALTVILLLLHWIMFRTGRRTWRLRELIQSEVEPWLADARHKHEDDFKPKDEPKRARARSTSNPR